VGVTVPNELWVADLRAGTTETALPGVSGIRSYSVSTDGKLVAFTLKAESGALELWIAALDRSAPPRKLAEVSSDAAVFGARHDLYYLKKEKDGLQSAYRVDYETGQEEKVASGPLLEITSVSPGGDWVILMLPKARLAGSVARPLKGGNDLPLCESCYAHWSADGGFLFLSFIGGSPLAGFPSVYALPVPRGKGLPPLFASGPKSEAEIAAAVKGIPGARTISQEGAGGIAPAADPSVYAYQKITTLRNLYRIPIPQ